MKKPLRHAILLFLLVAGCSDRNSSGGVSQDESTESDEEFEFQVTYGYGRDPIENDPRHLEVFRRIDSEVNQLLLNHPGKGQIGFVHVFWQTKKERLKETYGIDWKSPADINTSISFD